MSLKMNFDCQRAQPRKLSPGRVIVAETGNNQHQQLLFAGRHVLLADRSALEGGGDTGPDPQSLMLMALGARISMALRASADNNGWRLEQITLLRIDAAGLRIQIVRREKARLPYDGISRPLGERPVPSCELPQHSRSGQRFGICKVGRLDAHVDAPRTIVPGSGDHRPDHGSPPGCFQFAAHSRAGTPARSSRRGGLTFMPARNRLPPEPGPGGAGCPAISADRVEGMSPLSRGNDDRPPCCGRRFQPTDQQALKRPRSRLFMGKPVVGRQVALGLRSVGQTRGRRIRSLRMTPDPSRRSRKSSRRGSNRSRRRRRTPPCKGRRVGCETPPQARRSPAVAERRPAGMTGHGPVNVGGVEQGDTEFERAVDGLPRGG
jgi:hypothetical protein